MPAWLDRLLGRKPADDDAEDRAALNDLRSSFARVHRRTDRLEQELTRINRDLRKRNEQALNDR
jgi:hypothetical protein